MPAPLERMLWAVANRFGFDGHDMTIGRLVFWYRGHEAICKEETEEANRVSGG